MKLENSFKPNADYDGKNCLSLWRSVKAGESKRHTDIQRIFVLKVLIKNDYIMD